MSGAFPWAELWSALNAMAAFFAAAVAFIAARNVARLTKTIALIDHRREIDNGWQAFMQIILENPELQEHAVKVSKAVDNHAALRSELLCLMRLNILYEGWHGLNTVGKINPEEQFQKFAEKMIGDQVAIMDRLYAPMLDRLLDDTAEPRGYLPDFLKYIAATREKIRNSQANADA